ERVDALESVLAEKRSKTFPLELFSRKPFSAPTVPDDELWAKLERYVSEKANIQERSRRLIALFRAALELPAISKADSALDCPLCGTPDALTQEQIAFIRDSVAHTEAFQAAETAALIALRDLQTKATEFSDAAAAA